MMKKSGFTLIEVMIAVVIVVIITILAIMVFQDQFSKARDSRRVGDMDMLQNQLERYILDTGSYPPGSNYEAMVLLLANEYQTRLADTQDPSADQSYSYQNLSPGYCLCANVERVENANADDTCDFSASVQDHYCVVNKQ